MRNVNLIYVLLTVLSFLFTSSCKQKPEGWTQFRGTNLSGYADEDAQPPIYFNTEQNLLWKLELPEGHSSPCIWEDNIFVTGFVKDKKELQTICINRISGEIKWIQSVYPENIEKFHAISNAAVATPTTDGERVYVYFGSYGLLCYNVYGQLEWEKPMPIQRVWYGSSSSPVLSGESLLLSRDFHGNGSLMALNKVTGETVWETQLPTVNKQHYNSTSYSTPLVMNEQVVLHRVYEVSAYSLKDGSRLWHIPLPSSGVSSPIFNKDVLYIGTWQEMGEKSRRGEFPDFFTMLSENDKNNDKFISKDEIPDSMLIFSRPEMMENSVYWKGAFRMIDQDKNGLVDEKEWTQMLKTFLNVYDETGLVALKPSGSDELPASQVLWKVTEKVPEVPSPVFCKDCVYMIKNGGIITCINAQSGNVIYSEKLNATGPYIASPIIANGNIYVPSVNGTISVIKPDNKLNILAQNDLNEKIYATPAVIGDILYVRTIKNIYAFADN